MQTYNKILSLKWRRLGDTILWTSALEALRQHLPQSEIHLAVPAAYATLFARDPRWQRVVPLENQFGVLIGRRLAANRYDLFLGFHAGERVRQIARWSATPTKVLHHHSRKPRIFSSDIEVPSLGQPMSAIERDLNVVRALGYQGPVPESKIYLPEQSKHAARQQLAQLGWNGKAPLIFLHPGASRLAKQWGLEKYAVLAERLPPTTFKIIIVQSKTEWSHQALSLAKLLRHASSLLTPDLVHLASTLSYGSLFVGSDSGLKHLACAVGVPTITLFGPESIGEWHGYPADRHIALRKTVLCRFNDVENPDFSWCGESICPLASHGCLSRISVEEVLTAVHRFI